MAAVTVYRGRIVGVNSREYSFADRATGEKIEGVTHRVYVVTDDALEPVVELKASDDVATQARSANGKLVEIHAEPRARDNRVVWHALGVKASG
jgi:hypothetical protein